MFYSNQILTSTQYGVSTIWLVATVGNSHHKRVTKRAIQEVNVPRACEKILNPGAPLALRLQGNLLYGVSRVFADQCNFVLSDAEKTQSDMMTFFRAIKSSNLDLPRAKAKRVSITLQDDPNFDPMSQLPPLDLNIIDTDWLKVPSQESASKYSQMSPLQAYTSRHSSVNRQTTFLHLELPPSSHSAGSCRMPLHLGKSSSPQSKMGNFDDMPDFVPFQAEEIDPFTSIDLEFDGDGNLVHALEDEPHLPPFFGDTPSNVSRPAPGAQPPNQQDLDELLIIGDEQILPDADAFPVPVPAASGKQAIVSETGESATATTTTEIVQQASAPVRVRRATKHTTMLDQEISLRRSEQRNWGENYVDLMTQFTHNHRRKTPTAGQAKSNALSFVFNNGIADVGIFSRSVGVHHTLAPQFSGWNLLAQLRPDDAFVQAAAAEMPQRQRRRKFADAFDDDGERQQQRNVRAKHADNGMAEVGRGQHTDELLQQQFHDDSQFETGMDAMPAMEDHHSSSLMPWSRQGSAVPGSSVRAAHPSSAQKLSSQVAASPLLHKSTGNFGALIDRHSDPVEPAAVATAASATHLFLDDSSMDMEPVLDFGNAAYAGLGGASQEFLDYASKLAVIHGFEASSSTSDENDGNAGSCRRRWVDFEHIANPVKHDGAIAAQAFLHILSLATRSIVSVRQENNEEGTQPFGTLHVGINLPPNTD